MHPLMLRVLGGVAQGRTRALKRVKNPVSWLRGRSPAGQEAVAQAILPQAPKRSPVQMSVVRSGPHPPSTPPPPYLLAAWAAARATSTYPPPPCPPMVSRPSPTVLALTDSAPVKTGQKRQGGEGGAEGGKHRRTGGKNQREGGKGGEPTQRQPEPTQRQRSPRRPPWSQKRPERTHW